MFRVINSIYGLRKLHLELSKQFGVSEDVHINIRKNEFSPTEVDLIESTLNNPPRIKAHIEWKEVESHIKWKRWNRMYYLIKNHTVDDLLFSYYLQVEEAVYILMKETDGLIDVESFTKEQGEYSYKIFGGVWVEVVFQKNF